jgi:hypothetical protein
VVLGALRCRFGGRSPFELILRGWDCGSLRGVLRRGEWFRTRPRKRDRSTVQRQYDRDRGSFSSGTRYF